jgi:hypothetical protein
MPAKDIKDTKLSGLYLRNRQGGNVWVVKAKQRGTSRVVTVTLGRADVVKVTQARDMAKPHLVALGAGEDPNLNKKRKAQAHQELGITLQGALDDYLGLGQRQPSTVKSYRQVMQRAFKDWLSRPIRNITRTDVLTRYKDIQKNVSKSSKWTQQANPKGLAELLNREARPLPKRWISIETEISQNTSRKITFKKIGSEDTNYIYRMADRWPDPS